MDASDINSNNIVNLFTKEKKLTKISVPLSKLPRVIVHKNGIYMQNPTISWDYHETEGYNTSNPTGQNPKQGELKESKLQGDLTRARTELQEYQDTIKAYIVEVTKTNEILHEKTKELEILERDYTIMAADNGRYSEIIRKLKEELKILRIQNRHLIKARGEDSLVNKTMTLDEFTEKIGNHAVGGIQYGLKELPKGEQMSQKIRLVNGGEVEEVVIHTFSNLIQYGEDYYMYSHLSHDKVPVYTKTIVQKLEEVIQPRICAIDVSDLRDNTKKRSLEKTKKRLLDDAIAIDIYNVEVLILEAQKQGVFGIVRNVNVRSAQYLKEYFSEFAMNIQELGNGGVKFSLSWGDNDGNTSRAT